MTKFVNLLKARPQLQCACKSLMTLSFLCYHVLRATLRALTMPITLLMTISIVVCVVRKLVNLPLSTLWYIICTHITLVRHIFTFYPERTPVFMPVSFVLLSHAQTWRERRSDQTRSEIRWTAKLGTCSKIQRKVHLNTMYNTHSTISILWMIYDSWPRQNY